jgi:asparagine synthase (glutamine-hydrolysing)
MKNKLPQAVLTRKKIGFDIPAHEWLRGPLRALLTDTVNAGLADHPGLFQPKAVQSLLQAHMDRRANLGYHLWGLLILFLWMKEWRIQAAPSPASHYSAPERTGIST